MLLVLAAVLVVVAMMMVTATPQSTNHPTVQPPQPISTNKPNHFDQRLNQQTTQPINQTTNFDQQAQPVPTTSQPINQPSNRSAKQPISANKPKLFFQPQNHFTLLYSPLQESTPLRIGGSTRLRRLSIFKSQGMTY